MSLIRTGPLEEDEREFSIASEITGKNAINAKPMKITINCDKKKKI